MRKILTAAAAALTLAGSMAATTTPALAQSHGGHGGGFHGGGGFRGGGFRGGGFRGGGFRGGRGFGVGAGLAGFALGAALAGPYGYGYGYGPGYGYGYGGYGDGCAQRVWDPYWGRWTVRYYC